MSVAYVTDATRAVLRQTTHRSIHCYTSATAWSVDRVAIAAIRRVFSFSALLHPLRSSSMPFIHWRPAHTLHGPDSNQSSMWKYLVHINKHTRTRYILHSIEQEAFEKWWAHSILRAAARRILHCHSPGVATVARCLCIDVHDNDNDNNDNA